MGQTKNPNRGHHAGRQIVLEVTSEIINVATERDSGHCVIADALKAAVPGASFVAVDLQTIRWTDREEGRRYIYLTPAPAQAVLVNFDQGIKPGPFRMRLGKPAQIVKVNPRAREGKPHEKHCRDGIKMPKGAKRELLPNSSASPESVPTVVGGGYPPTAALSSTRGRRRTFGLRSLRP